MPLSASDSTDKHILQIRQTLEDYPVSSLCCRLQVAAAAVFALYHVRGMTSTLIVSVDGKVERIHVNYRMNVYLKGAKVKVLEWPLQITDLSQLFVTKSQIT
ncbi:hypothetical protein ILYODFUR_020459 [Ilyodon furcidens]|uniref:Uncharacterized protein n=1 Tax=Ilyodon furcidens TaxID=33524 RepID=A0ABV0UI98_9TELE